MSVLIKGMDMPKGGCWECPLRAGLNCSILSESVCDYMNGYSMYPNCPLVEVSIPVRHGKWLWLDGVRCSECNYKIPTIGLPNYCPNCGADMRGESND